MEPKYIQAGDQRIAYYESTGKGPAVIFVHGSSLSALNFMPQIKSALGTKFRFIGLDLPGHGCSGPAIHPEETYTLPGLAGIVASFVKELSIGKAVFVGCSLGGHILLEASDRLNAHGIMIFGTPPLDNPCSVDGIFLLPESLVASLYKKHLSYEELDALTTAYIKTDSEFDRKPLIEDILRADGVFRETLGQSVFQGQFTGETDIVRNLSVPLAILHGEEDQVVEKSYFDSLTIPSLWRGAVQIISGAGHLPNLEQPEAFNRLLEDFVMDVL